MILKQDLKWSPDGMRVEIIRAGEYEDKELPERVREIATAAGIVSDKRTPVARGLISLKTAFIEVAQMMPTLKSFVFSAGLMMTMNRRILFL